MHWSVHINGDPNLTLETDQIERQFLIKWKGWSHINNTWESESSLGRFHYFLKQRLSTLCVSFQFFCMYSLDRKILQLLLREGKNLLVPTKITLLVFGIKL